MKRTFVIGDVHGNFDRLVALIDEQDATARDVEIVQLGDLGQFSADTLGNDPRAYEAAIELIDVVLWGNHDRAVVDPAHHAFQGFSPPAPETAEHMATLQATGEMRMAHHAHGHLLTHAGVHPAFETQLPADPAAAAAAINRAAEHKQDPVALWDNGSAYRGFAGQMPGGILWRDIREPLSDRWRQIFGHSRGDTVRNENGHWCVDVGSRDNGRLAGLWLPELRIAEVAL